MHLVPSTYVCMVDIRIFPWRYGWCAPVNGSLRMLACKYEMRSFSYFSFISFQSSFYYFYSTQNLDDTTCIWFLGFWFFVFAFLLPCNESACKLNTQNGSKLLNAETRKNHEMKSKRFVSCATINLSVFWRILEDILLSFSIPTLFPPNKNHNKKVWFHEELNYNLFFNYKHYKCFCDQYDAPNTKRDQ